MVTSSYHIGDLRVLSAQFRVGTTLTDPSALTFEMLEPDGVKTTYTQGVDAELVKDGTGQFHVDWTIAKAGRHFIRWAGTGAAQEANEGEFYALPKGTG